MTFDELVPIAEAAAKAYPAVTVPQLLAIWAIESNWNPDAVNASSKATGLGQVMPREAGFADRPTIEELKDPATNAEWTARILSDNLRRSNGDLRQAVKWYSGGWKASGDDAFERVYWQPFLDKLAEIEKLYQKGVTVKDWTRYPRPPDDTGAGVHGGANAYFPLGDNDGLVHGILDEMHRCGLRWVKLLDADGSSYNVCRMVLEHGMMPVVRLYRERPYPGRLTEKQLAAAADLVRLGVRYFERGNEPNVDWEWQPEYWPGYDWNAWDGAVWAQLAAEWYDDALALSRLGAYVAIDACSPGGHYDDIMYLQRFFAALKLVDGAMSLLYDYGWLAVHPAGLNHPLDYPDDAVIQAEHPGQTIHSHFDGIQPTGASNCIRKPEAVYKLFVDTFGFGVPVLATEGGFWPGRRDDNRYPETTVQTASEMNFSTLHGMAKAPAWYFAFMPWLWFNRLGANLEPGFERDAWKRIPGWGSCPNWEPAVQPIINMLLAEPCQRREVMPEPTPEPSKSFTDAEKQRCRNAFATVPATMKAAVERDCVWLKEIYSSGDAYAFALVWNRTTRRYQALKLETRTWQVVAETTL